MPHFSASHKARVHCIEHTHREKGRERERTMEGRVLEDWAGRAATGMGKSPKPGRLAQHLVPPGDTTGQIGNHDGPRKEKP